MTLDYDVCMNMPLNELYTLQHRISHLIEDIDTMLLDVDKVGFDTRTPLESDSFLVPKLIAFKADLLYVQEELDKIENERKLKKVDE